MIEELLVYSLACSKCSVNSSLTKGEAKGGEDLGVATK